MKIYDKAKKTKDPREDRIRVCLGYVLPSFQICEQSWPLLLAETTPLATDILALSLCLSLSLALSLSHVSECDVIRAQRGPRTQTKYEKNWWGIVAVMTVQFLTRGSRW